jgi:hypothetical protein
MATADGGGSGTRTIRLLIVLVFALNAVLIAALLFAPSAKREAPQADTFEGIDAYPSYVKPTCLKPVMQPGVRAFRDMILAEVGGESGGIHACTGFEHGEGRAWDWMMDARSPADRARVNEVLDWLLRDSDRGVPHANARRLGIGYIIWNRRIIQLWDYVADKTWRPYVGASPHTDHVHFSFSWAGAREQTTYWVRRSHPPTWLLANTLTANAASVAPFSYGAGGSTAIAGDWNGDGVDTPGGYDPRRRRFSLRNSPGAGEPDLTFTAGRFGDVPLVGDWDGDGRDEVGLYRPTSRQFLFLGRSNDTAEPALVFGDAGDRPLVGNFDPSDPDDEVGVFRRPTSTFYLRMNDGQVRMVQFGVAGDVPVVGDWLGGGFDGIGVFRPSTHAFTVQLFAPNGHSELRTVSYGQSGDVPVIGDWDGNGADSQGVTRFS